MFERFLLVFVVVWALGLGFWHGAEGLSSHELIAGGAILILSFLLRWYIQHVIDVDVSVVFS